MWRARYTEDPGILGRSVLVNGSPATVVGIMPDASGFPTTSVAWLPLEQSLASASASPDTRRLRVFGRLRDGASESDARAEVASAMASLASDRPSTDASVQPRVVPINERLLLRVEGPWLAFLSAGCTIVVISCANVDNLMLARGFDRAREVAVRASLGASRARIFRQWLVEAIVLPSRAGRQAWVYRWWGSSHWRSRSPSSCWPRSRSRHSAFE